MTFRESDRLRYFVFESLATQSDLVHAVFTRRGGVSPAPWASLNVGGSVGDDRARVVENRERSFRALGRPVEGVADLWQVHSATVVTPQEPRRGTSTVIQGDGLITDRADLTLFMRFADCVPVLLYDPRRQAVGIAHAGWRGTVQGVAREVVRCLGQTFGSRPADLLAGIGPSVGPDHYTVGPEVVAEMQSVFGRSGEAILHREDERWHLDLWQANRLQLAEAGVERIEVAGVCTACNLEDWYSHRGEHGQTGRFGAMIALRSD